MQVNVEKSYVMWFCVKSCNSLTTVPSILLESTPLVNVSKQKYLGITIDSNLTWAYHVSIFTIPPGTCEEAKAYGARSHSFSLNQMT